MLFLAQVLCGAVVADEETKSECGGAGQYRPFALELTARTKGN